MKKLLSFLFGLPKTIFFNFKMLPFSQAIKLPVWIAFDVKLGSLSGKRNLILKHCKFGVVKFGFGGSFNLGGPGFVSIKDKCIMHGSFSIGRGVQFVVEKGGSAEFGDHFVVNANCILNTGRNAMYFGRDFLGGWGITLLAGDGHMVYPIGCVPCNEKKDFYIGNHVWIGSDVKCLKGIRVGNDSVVAANSLITKSFQKDNLLIGGTNRIIKENVTWQW